MTVRRAAKISFAVLTVVLIAAVVELGAFLLLSATAGRPISWSDVWALQASRQGIEPVTPVVHAKRWAEHRIAVVPSLHPYLGYVFDPTTSRVRSDAGRWNVEAGAFGFPLNRHSPFQEAAADRLVVGVLGGSLAEQLALSGQLERQLRRRVRFAGRRIVVISLALGGYKQPQQLMALNYFLALGAHFDVVLNIDGFNEVALPAVTNVPKGYFPFFPRGWVLQVGDLDQELRRLAGELTYLRRRRADLAAAFAGSPWRYSMVCALVWKSFDARLTHRIVASERTLEKRDSTASGDFQAYGPAREYPSKSAMFQDLVGVWRQGSLQIHALTQGLGIEYHHFLQPNQYVPGSKPLTAAEREQAWDETHPYKPVVERAYPLLRREGETLVLRGVDFHDLTNLFVDIDETLYRDTCCHVNARGNRLLAAAIAEAAAEAP